MLAKNLKTYGVFSFSFSFFERHQFAAIEEAVLKIRVIICGYNIYFTHIKKHCQQIHYRGI